MFQFKKFSVEDSDSTMKVGTDGVLVGAWADVEGATSILDIGSGCGLIALMMAQRSKAKRIDAIEIDPASAEQAGHNVANSPWQKRIQVINTSLQIFSKNQSRTYDLLVSNPPFFENSLKPGDRKKNLSKHTDSLSFTELLMHASRLMHNDSRFCVILPWDQQVRFTNLALAAGLYKTKELSIIPREGRITNRIIMELRRKRQANASQQIAIRSRDGSNTAEYRNLTRDFYLQF